MKNQARPQFSSIFGPENEFFWGNIFLTQIKVCIEDLTELREWMETVPIELENLTEEVEHAVNDYELVEEFYYPLRKVFKSFRID